MPVRTACVKRNSRQKFERVENSMHDKLAVYFFVSSNFRFGFYAALLAAAIGGIFFYQLWQPERQVLLHSAHFLTEIEKKNWPAVADFVAPDYADRWENDRTQFLQRLREVSRFCGSVAIEAKNPQARAEDRNGSWLAKISLTGGTGEYAPVIRERVNSLSAPFELRWRRESAKPWGWKLVAIDNPALQLPAGAD